MIKKNMFIYGLVTGLKAKVDLKQPSSFEDAVRLAKEKEWKIRRKREFGISVDDVYLPRYVCEEPYAWTMGMYYTPPVFEKPKMACAVLIEEVLESPKMDATPCVALIKDVAKTKVDQVLMNKMKLPKKMAEAVNDETMVADPKKEESMVESMPIAVVQPKQVTRGMYQMPPEFFASMKKDKVESMVEVFKLIVDDEQERDLMTDPMSNENADEPMDDESHVEDKFIDEDMLKDVQVADPDLMLEEELVIGDDMMKMEEFPPSGEPSTLQVLEEQESMEDQGAYFILDSDDEEGWLEMATLLHIDVHEDDTKGVGNMSPNDFCLQD